MALQDLHAKPGHLIRRLQQIAVALFIAETVKLDLTPIQFASLSAIRDVPDLDATRLSTLVALDRATLAQVLERLEAKRWIVRVSSPEDKRIKRLAITAQGRAVLRRAEPGMERAQRRILAPLTATERATFMRLLAHLVARNNEHSRAPLRPMQPPAKRRKVRTRRAPTSS
jgi:DNA-binding MarR family transcriptional regulator